MTKLTQKLNNRGFSLVELMVGVAILAIVIVPLLNAFIVSQRISAKSHFAGEATLVSRNIVENIKAEGIQSIIDIEDGTVWPSAEPFGPGLVMTPYSAGGPLGDWDETTGVYTYVINDVPAGTFALTSGGTHNATYFHAVVTFDPRPYQGAIVGGVQLNDMPIAQYMPMDTNYPQPKDTPLEVKDPDTFAVENFINEEAAIGTIPLPGPEDVRPLTTRYITLDITRDIPNGTALINIKYEYMYKTFPTYEGEDIGIYDKDYDPTDPNNEIVVYIFYRPFYDSLNDIITINNDDMVNVSVYLVKQTPVHPYDPFGIIWADDDTSRGLFAGFETTYKARIVQNENVSLHSFAGSTPATTIYTNFTENYGNSTLGAYSHLVWYGMNSDPGVRKPLASQTTRNRIYEVTVTIYERDATGGMGPELLRMTASNLD